MNKQSCIGIFTLFLLILSAAMTSKGVTFTVTRSDDRNNATCVFGDCSLREAVKDANNLPTDDTINFAANVATILLTSHLQIFSNGTLIINGRSANGFTINGRNLGRIFTISNATVTITDVTLIGGSGSGSGADNGRGGAIYVNQGSLTLDRIYFTGNAATATGGGVCFFGGTDHQIRNSTFFNNTAVACGGFANDGGTLIVANSTFSGNVASGNGGGFCTTGSGTTTIRNSTVTGNIANQTGGGIFHSGGTLNFGNTIVAGNSALASLGPEINFASGTVTSAGNNLVGDSAGDSINTNNPITYLVGGLFDVRDTPPMLASLTINNGGPTPTHSLAPNSPAINAGGASDIIQSPFSLNTDQRGFPRFIGSFADIGAYEFNPNAPGSLDTSFGTNGTVITQTAGGTNYATATAIQPDGKIVAVGSTNGFFSIVRYNVNGTLDNTFNGNGISVSVVGVSNALAIQPDGKIVVVGHNGDPANIEFKVARFNPNGTLDSTFDGDGVVVTPIGDGTDAAYSVAIQTDGKIVVSGRSDSNPVFVTTWAVVRYNADGSLDTTFDNDGIIIPPSRGNAIADALAIQPDGKIVVAHNNYNGSAYILEVLRYNTNGSPDTNFGSGGVILTTVGTNVEQVSVAIQTNGRIVAACSSFTGNSAGYDFWVVRYNGNGSLDTTFGGNGLVVTPIGSGNSFDVPRSVAIQANGKIVVGGKSQNGTNNNFALVRYNPNGSLDSHWGIGGIVTTDLGGSAESINAVAIQLNGRIVAAGESDAASPGTRRFAVARYIGDAAADFDYDRDGAGDISVFRPSEGNWYVLGSANGSFSGFHWGNSTDKPVAADFDGDLKTDLAVWRSGAFAYFYILNSSDNTFRSEQFGQTGDDPSIVGDYDGDGKADPAVYRNAAVGNQSYFYYRGSRNNLSSTITFVPWGASGDVPVRGDYSGDGRLDPTVFRPLNGVWYSLNSAANISTATQWGLSTDKLVPADYNGDGRTDYAVFRNGLWCILPSNSTAAQYFNWGNSTDKPVAADYDGDGRADVAVFRDGNWHIQQSTGGTRSVLFGLSTDIPTPTAYLP